MSRRVGKFRIRFAGQTDVGQTRSHNEDNFKIDESVPIAVLADGMGGHASGEVASQITVDRISHFYKEGAGVQPATWPLRIPHEKAQRMRMSTAIKLANRSIFEQAKQNRKQSGMGCTVEAMYFDPTGVLFIGHVGDSRVYRLRDGRLEQLTEDHSLWNDYQKMKLLRGEHIEEMKQRNVVVRALGLTEQVEPEVLAYAIEAGDLYLACSDGLTDMVADEDLPALLEAASLKQICKKLVDEANRAGGQDNITALLAQVDSV